MKIDIENLRVVGELTHKYIHIFFYYKMNNARKNLPYMQEIYMKIKNGKLFEGQMSWGLIKKYQLTFVDFDRNLADFSRNLADFVKILAEIN